MNTPNQFELLQGNAACAAGAIAAGCRFYAGYPITPSSEVASEMARRLPRVGGIFVQMEDELASMAAVIGASLGGVKAMTATSGPGFSLMQENLGYAAYCEIPCVVVNVMRGGPSTGLPTSPSQADIMQARWGTHGDHPSIVLAPGSVGEIYDQTIRAFALSERYRTPVVVTYDEVLAHMREPVHVPDPEANSIGTREAPQEDPADYRPYRHTASGIPPLASFGQGYRFHVTGLAHDERGFQTEDRGEIDKLIKRLHAKIDSHLDDILLYEETDLEDAEVAVFSFGISARSARQAVARARQSGIRAGLFRPITIWPFPQAPLREVARRVGRILVVEMNLGQLRGEVERACGALARVDGCHRTDGNPILPAQVAEAIRDGK